MDGGDPTRTPGDVGVLAHTSDEVVAATVDRLREAVSATEATSRVREAMIGLLRLRYDPEVRPGAEDQARLRELSTELLERAPAVFSDYVRRLSIEADVVSTNERDYVRLCRRRSAVQLMLDEVDASRDIDVSELLAETDGEMATLNGLYTPIDEREIPADVPPSHWWWRFLPDSELAELKERYGAD